VSAAGGTEAPSPLSALLEAHLAHLETSGAAAHTVKNRKSHVGSFLAWCEPRGILRPTEITLPVLERFQRHQLHHRRENGRPLGSETQAQRLSAVCCFLRWLVRSGKLLYNPAAELERPRRAQRIPRAVLSAAEAEAVLARPDLTTALGLRDRAILELFYSSGLRRLELLSLRVSDLDEERGLLLIREGKGRKDRYVPVGERALQWLGRYLEEVRPRLARSLAEPALFLTVRGRSFRPNRLSELVQRYVKEAGLGKQGSCHLWRHTAATLMHENGADIRDVQEMLGHADLSTTQVYTRVSIHRLKAVHAKTHPAGRATTQEVD
jgi:integrase/recombinase XerD